MDTYTTITNTTEFADALKRLQNDIPRYMAASGRRKATVSLPKPLVDLVEKRGNVSYELVKQSLNERLSQFCAIGEWERGKDDRGDNYIHFKLIPERVRDGD